MNRKRYEVIAKLCHKIIDRYDTNEYVLALAELESFEEKYGQKYDVEFIDNTGGFRRGY